MKNLIITFASKFPKRSGYEGEPTNFQPYIENGLKRHTIRENYEYWSERLTRDPDNTSLRLRMWSGKPRQSLQFEIGHHPCNIVTYQTIQLHKILDDLVVIDGLDVPLKMVAENDGLQPEVFIDWFKSFAGDNKKCILISLYGETYRKENNRIIYN